MNTSTLLIILVLLIVGGGVVYTVLPNTGTEVPAEEAMESTMDQNTDGETMIEKESGEMMEKDAMQVGDAMEGAAMEKENGTLMDADDSMMKGGGTYEAYAPEKLARAEEGKVVLFFRASWCPTCRALDGDIRAHLKEIPADVTILDVNYDTETALKQKYGVTYQHTLVQVDAAGNQLAKWSGSTTLSALLASTR